MSEQSLRSASLDAYMWGHVAHHLVEAGRADELRRLLLDPAWLLRKIEATDVTALLADFDRLAADPVSAEVAGAVRLARSVVGNDPSQLPGQLVARLAHSSTPEVAAMVERVRADRSRTWLRPTAATLTPPGAGLLARFDGPAGGSGPSRASGVAVTADGFRAVSAGPDGAIARWDPDSGDSAILEPPTQDVRPWRSYETKGAAVSADGRHALSVDGDGRMWTWDLAAGRVVEGPLRPVVEPEDTSMFSSCVLSANHDLTFAAVATPGRFPRTAVTLWDLVARQIVATIEWPTGIDALAMSGDGVIALDGAGRLLRCDVATGAAVLLDAPRTEGARGLAVSADGERAVYTAHDEVVIWDVSTDRLIGQLPAAATSVAIAGAVGRAVTAGVDGCLEVWDLATGSRLARIPGLEGTLGAVAVTADGTRALAAGEDGAVSWWDLTAVGAGGTPASATVNAVALDPAATRAVSADDRGDVVLWYPATGQRAGHLDGHGDPAPVDKAVWRWVDTPGGGISGRSSDGAAVMVFGVALSADAGRLVSTGADGTLRVWELPSGRLVHRLTGHSGPVWSVDVTADGGVAITGGDDGDVRVWDLDAGTSAVLGGGRLSRFRRRLRTIEWSDATERAVNAVSIAADGRRAISGRGDGKVTLWDVSRGRATATRREHGGAVRAVAISADGRRALSGGADRTIRVWDLDQGMLLGAIAGPEGSVRGLAVTRDGSLAVSASADRTIRVWDLATTALLATFTVEAGVEAVSISDDGVIVAGDRRGVVHHLTLVRAGI